MPVRTKTVNPKSGSKTKKNRETLPPLRPAAKSAARSSKRSSTKSPAKKTAKSDTAKPPTSPASRKRRALSSPSTSPLAPNAADIVELTKRPAPVDDFLKEINEELSVKLEGAGMFVGLPDGHLVAPSEEDPTIGIPQDQLAAECDKLIALMAKKAILSREIESLKSEIESREVAINKAMENQGMKGLKLMTGEQITAVTKFLWRLPKKDDAELREKALAWLVERGDGALIEASVHANRLESHLNDLMKQNVEIPKELFPLTERRSLSITGKREMTEQEILELTVNS